MARTAAAIEADKAETVCVCFLEEVTDARADFTVRKIARQAPSSKVIVCLLGETPDTRDVAESSSDAPRSLAAVLTAAEKNTTCLGRREQ